MRLYIMVGLPGSGKTYYAKKLSAMIDVTYIDGDAFSGSIDKFINYIKLKHDDIVVDGLFLTREVQDKFIDAFSLVSFIYFKPNIEACIYNDSLRDREHNSKAVILNSKINKPDNNIYEEKDVIRYDYVQFIISEIEIKSWEYRSDDWTTGGTYGTCWDEDGPSICSIDEPLDATECPGYVKILKYFNIKDTDYTEYLEEEKTTENDYYGGCQESSYWELNVEGLIKEILNDLYGIVDIDYHSVYKNHPELFL